MRPAYSLRFVKLQHDLFQYQILLLELSLMRLTLKSHQIHYELDMLEMVQLIILRFDMLSCSSCLYKITPQSKDCGVNLGLCYIFYLMNLESSLLPSALWPDINNPLVVSSGPPTVALNVRSTDLLSPIEEL